VISWLEDGIPVITPEWQTECWLLDPGPFIDIAFDMGFRNFVFRSQYHEKIKQDFSKWIDVYARGREWKCIWMPYPANFAVLFTSKKGWSQHEAIWPVWRSKEDSFETFNKMFYEPPPPGTVLGSFGVDRHDHRPIEVTDHQDDGVVVAAMPTSPYAWAEIAQALQIAQATVPSQMIHFHGQKSVGRTIGIAAKSFDHPVRIGWTDGWPRILLPNGMLWETIKEPVESQRLWLSVIGVDHKNLFDLTGKDLSRRVYEINLMSLRWALLNWSRAWDFRRVAWMEEDEEATSDLDWSPKTLPIRLRKTKTERENLDRWLCDSCSLQNKCPYAREGSVCIVPDSEPAEIVEMFGTRNSSQIINGLGALLQAQGRRMQRAMKEEDDLAAAVAAGDFDEEDDTGKKRKAKPKVVLSRELTVLQNSMFKNAVALAKMVDPTMAKQLGTKVNVQMVNVGSGSDLTPQALMEGVSVALAERGIRMEDATEEMIQAVLAEMTGAAPAAIEATGREL